MIRLFPLLLLLVLAACQRTDDPRVQWGKDCAGYGFKPKSEAFATCMLKQQELAQQRDLANPAPPPASPALPPVRPPACRPVPGGYFCQ